SEQSLRCSATNHPRSESSTEQVTLRRVPSGAPNSASSTSASASASRVNSFSTSSYPWSACSWAVRGSSTSTRKNRMPQISRATSTRASRTWPTRRPMRRPTDRCPCAPRPEGPVPSAAAVPCSPIGALLLVRTGCLIADGAGSRAPARAWCRSPVAPPWCAGPMSGTSMLLLGLLLGAVLGAVLTWLVMRERARGLEQRRRTDADSAGHLLRLADERHERDVARRDAAEEEREAELQRTLAPITATLSHLERSLARSEAARVEAEGPHGARPLGRGAAAQHRRGRRDAGARRLLRADLGNPGRRGEAPAPRPGRAPGRGPPRGGRREGTDGRLPRRDRGDRSRARRG